MSHFAVRCCVGLIVTCSAALASAQTPVDNIGQEGQLVVGAEHLTGMYWHTRTTTETSTVGSQTVETETTESRTQLALVGNSPSHEYAVPRFAFDYFVQESISVGLGFGYLSRTGEDKTKTTQGSTTSEVSDDAPSQTAFVLHPRVGYAIPFDDTFGFWPRVGFLYAHSSLESEDTQGNVTTTTTISLNYTAISLEGMFFISPFSHFAIVGGPFYNLGLGGGSELRVEAGPQTTTTENDAKLSSFGLAIGVAGYL